jgi:phosphoribosylformimino-5-aminoimidazole carboxamide ribotide isomerase
MRIIPVIDLLNGVVVRGVAGRRAEYRPVQSVLTAEATPAAIGRALAELRFTDTYVADLDAIGGAEPAWETYAVLTRLGLRLWVDAGVSDLDRGRRMAEFHADGTPLAAVIVGSESLPDLAMLGELLKLLGPERMIFSLDLHDGRPLTPIAGWETTPPLQIAHQVLRVGLQRIIVLDLARVGMRQGTGSDDLCRQLRTFAPNLEIISGGGVRGADDLNRLQAAGCDAALVASALHDGRISPPA